ncbi:MAG TPA: hypothetical protein ENL27_02935, partial [Candidatus Parcubacteria bacterium]|nr:hypothetical protein [Candidatus Parcubacteria bacterium]
MDFFLIVALLCILIVLASLGFYAFFQKKKNKWFLSRGMNLALFLVTLPQIVKREKEKEASLQEYLKTVEQFFSSLSGIKEPNAIRRFFLGNPFFVFEIAVHRN